MAHDTENLAIFRGLLKFKSNVQKIWGVLIFLSIVTTVEVILGIVKPKSYGDVFRDENLELDIHHINDCKSILYCLGLYAHPRRKR